MTRNGAMALAALVLLSAAGQAAAGYQYDAADFATQVVDYVAGEGPARDSVSPYALMTDPNSALGRPTVDTSPDPYRFGMPAPVPVVPVYPAFRAAELVSIGEGGRLTLKFGRMVRDNPYNPFGVDLILFGNSHQLASGPGWVNGDPNTTVLSALQNVELVNSEPGVVSVSQDGATWYTLPEADSSASPPIYGADDFAPTLGRRYDPNSPEPSLGAWNLWWGQPTNPTLPMDPALTARHFAGMTLTEMVRQYGSSAGGTGLDLAQFDLPVDPATGMKWIQYVRVENPINSGNSPEIDAAADVFARRGGDANLDGVVDVGDLGILGQHYGQGGKTWEQADFNGDGVVDVGDLGILGSNYGMNNGEYFPASGGSLVVAEPATVASLLAAGAAILRRRRNRPAHAPAARTR